MTKLYLSINIYNLILANKYRLLFVCLITKNKNMKLDNWKKQFTSYKNTIMQNTHMYLNNNKNRLH